MNATKAMEQSEDSRLQDSRRPYCDLDNRYGKIGISAVAAALRYHGGPHTAIESRFAPRDSD